jgi:hypothetical protein
VKATLFEARHALLVHQLIVGLAILTYLFDREDIVWRFVKGTAEPHQLERFLFILAAVFVAAGAALCTWARGRGTAKLASGSDSQRTPQCALYLGDMCYAIGLGSLLPVAGFTILVSGDALRIFRLIRRESDPANRSSLPVAPRKLRWSAAVRKEAIKWGILISVIVFSITLVDRQADILVGLSFVLGTLLNTPLLRTSS